LTLVRRLVEAHGGTVYALSKGIGTGSEFVVRLPLLLETRPDEAIPKAPMAQENGRKQLRVMVVDDDLDVSESTAELLRFEGCEVCNFNDGASALEELNRFKPDAVLLDIAMPSMDGYELAQRIRATPKGDQLVLIAASGYGRREDLERSKKAGFDAHLVKPLDTDVLMSKLTALCPTRELTLTKERADSLRVADR
jgi:CheY-like chemotaxis protein